MTHKSEIIKLIIEGIQERKGKKIAVVDLSHIEGSAANTFIICQGSSPTQVDAIADSVREYVQEHCGAKPYNYDGYQNSQWIVISSYPTSGNIIISRNYGATPQSQKFRI